jgi:hypothetical protein
VIYPTLDYLQDQALSPLRKKKTGVRALRLPWRDNTGWMKIGNSWTDPGAYQSALRRFPVAKNPQMKRALDNFKAVLDLKVNQGELSDAQLKQIIGVIDRAALEISQLD